ncbi:flowering locus K homology domain-like isoform X1 [Aristolochia californica]|uniref:flowering locus K homology domain-like isoform X1 n=1 Tax=Aristolochia californica TaxID=171875 RepID=UPI0035E04372
MSEDKCGVPGSPSPLSSVSEEGEDKKDSSRKRPRDYDSDSDNHENLNDTAPPPDDCRSSDDAPASKRRGKSHDVLFRIVVPSRQIGRVIGKGGSQIRRIREETRAAIKIADAVARHEERVIIISSRDDASVISDAESALYHIAEVILQGDEGLTTSVGPGHAASSTIKLLIAGSQAGCLIGVSGQTIENIRSSSGATVMILAQNQLPSCASAHESDRLVQVSGSIQEVLKALEKIANQLRGNPPKKVIAVRPTYNGSSAHSDRHLTLSSAEHVTSEMIIAEALIGGLIGKHGSNISMIRRESGATIKVTGGKGEQEQRLIHFSGTSQQVAIATQLVERYIHSQVL